MQTMSVPWRKSSYSGNGGQDCVEVASAPWRTSSYSSGNGGQCVEVADEPWRKSSHSANGGQDCVEVAGADTVLVRDTTDRDGVTLRVPADGWAKFTASLR
jgi:Domain of unknown function (DUF397)